MWASTAAARLKLWSKRKPVAVSTRCYLNLMAAVIPALLAMMLRKWECKLLAKLSATRDGGRRRSKGSRKGARMGNKLWKILMT